MSDENTTAVAIGNYTARAIKGTEQYAPTKNDEPQIAIDFAIVGGDFEGAVMTVTFPFAGKAPEWSVKKLRMCGWAGDNLEDLSGVDTNEVPVRVFDNVYNGKTTRKMEIDFAGDGRFKFQKTMDPRQKKAFAASFAHVVKANPAKTGGDDFPTSYGEGKPSY